VSHDEFADLGSWDEATAATWVERLDARASASDQIRLRAEVLRQAELEAGSRAVEVGCGTGAMLVELGRDEVREAPDRPGREFVFFARRPD
jgi:ubiquinone/menaquinone biosynthesis C-methylase UbiE